LASSSVMRVWTRSERVDMMVPPWAIRGVGV